MKAYLYQPGYNGEPNVTTDIELNGHDLFLKLGKRLYRCSVDDTGNIEIVLINGHDCQISAWSGYPSIKLTVPESAYDPKEYHNKE